MTGVPHRSQRLVALLAIAASVLAWAAMQAQSRSAKPSGVDWPVYGGPGQTRYSPLNQIKRSNVRQLTVAWTFDTGEQGGLQTSPIVAGGVLYGLTPTHKVVALDAVSGARRWLFDSGIVGRGPNRGLMYWTDGQTARIFTAQNTYIYALDAATGAPVAGFGTNGRIDLREGLGRDPDAQSVLLTTPGVIYQDLMIVGGRVAENLPASPGDIRAFDVRTGALKWTFHTIPRPGEAGYDTWPPDAWTYTGGANNWAGMALDQQRGIVFAPTGSAASDFYGANRHGDNLYADSLLALDARTGKLLWHFQDVHHDIWDRDIPSPPSLVAVKRNGRTVDAVAFTTKHGQVFVFDRATGMSLFPLQTRAYPASTVEGEQAATMQTLPVKPMPFARQLLTEDMLTTRTPEAHRAALETLRTVRSEGQFVPLSLDRDTVILPGFDGGAEWGGSAFDPATGILYVNANEMAWLARLAPTGAPTGGPTSMKYRFTGFRKFLDTDGYPAIAPPWGTLNAINLNTGDYAWKVPLGEYPELAAAGMKNTGSENYGGPVVTAGGVVFIGATNFDRKFHAFDSRTGELLWETLLPYSGNATPIT